MTAPRSFSRLSCGTTTARSPKPNTRFGGCHRLAELEVHVVGVIAVLDAGHGHPEHESLGVRVVVPDLYELVEGPLRDREPVGRRIVFAHLMASAADPSHREMDG